MQSVRNVLLGENMRAMHVVAAAIALFASFADACAAEPRLESVGYDTGWAHDENSGNGYAYFSAHTFVDCKNTRIGYRQSADILTGGYTHDASGRERSYADMGLVLENDTLSRGETARRRRTVRRGCSVFRTRAMRRSGFLQSRLGSGDRPRFVIHHQGMADEELGLDQRE